MSQSTATHHQQTEEHPTQTYHAEITARNDGRQVPTQLTVPSDAAQIPDQQLQTGIRSEAFGGEFDGQIVVDARPQIRFLPSHSTWPFVFGEREYRHFQITGTKGLFAMGDSQIHRRMARTEQPKFHRVNAESRSGYDHSTNMEVILVHKFLKGGSCMPLKAETHSYPVRGKATR